VHRTLCGLEHIGTISLIDPRLVPQPKSSFKVIQEIQDLLQDFNEETIY